MFPKDPYINYSFYPTGLGQLTIVSNITLKNKIKVL